MRSWTRIIEIVRSHHFTSNALVVKLHQLVLISTLKIVKVLDSEHVQLVPSKFEPWTFQSVFLCKRRIEKIKDLLLIKLKKWAIYSKRLTSSYFLILESNEELFDCSWNNSNMRTLLYHSLLVLIIISFHCKSLSRSSLSISEDSCMIPFYDMIDVFSNMAVHINILLRFLFINDSIK